MSRGDDELGLAPDQVRCDVWAFEAAVDQGRPADALALYRGELLAGFHISAAPDFERWLDEERSRLRQRAGEAAGRWRPRGSVTATLPARRRRHARRPPSLPPRRLRFVAWFSCWSVSVTGRAPCAPTRHFAWRLQGEYELEPSAETQALVARIRAEPGEGQAAARAIKWAFSRGWERELQGSHAGSGALDRPPAGAADLLREFEFRSPGLVAEPTPVSSPSRARRPAAIVAGAVVMLLLLGLAGLYLRTQARDRTVRAPAPPAGEAAPGIAVLPFAVQDGALANWREGLVDLVSIDLSGVAGLRAVDSRTLLARWRERVGGADNPELATALDVAERAGARYAVVGSLIANGPDLILTAGVHQVAGRRMLGTARSQAPADSIFTLVDRLTLEILRLILRGEARELPRIDLARVSTASLPALKSYLEGEVLFRRSQFQSAAEAYARAVDADSNFVLARYRLGLSRWWFGETSDCAPTPSNTEVGPVADRLPPHEAAIFRASLLRAQDVRAARELLEEGGAPESRRRGDLARARRALPPQRCAGAGSARGGGSSVRQGDRARFDLHPAIHPSHRPCDQRGEHDRRCPAARHVQPACAGESLRGLVSPSDRVRAR